MSDITAKVKLDYSGFLGGVRRVDAGLVEMQRRAIGLSAAFQGIAWAGGAALAGIAAAAMKIKGAFDLGGELSDMSAAMGMSAGQILILRQAFANAGLGGDQFAGAIARMQKALGGVDEEGKSTEAALARMNLAAGDFSGLGADEQIRKLGAGFSQIADPSTRARTAMELFGRSGAKMLAILSDSGAMETAAVQVGSLGALMDKNAVKFDAISDAMGTMKLKSDQLWSGMAEQLAPAVAESADEFSRLDFTGIGAGIARAAQNTANFAKTLQGLSDKLPQVRAIKGVLEKIGFKTYGDLAEASNVEGLQRRNSGTETGIDKARGMMASEDDRAALLGRINNETRVSAELLAQVENETHAVFSAYKPERIEAVKNELKGHLAVLNAQRGAVESVALAQKSHARAAKESAEAMEALAKTQERLVELRGDAIGDLRKFRQDQELANADTPEAKRKILMGRSGQKDVAGIESEIARLEGLQKGKVTSTTESEIAELKSKLGILGQINDIDRAIAKDGLGKAQDEIDAKGKDAAKLLDPAQLPQMKVWADSARSVGLGGNAATNGQEIAKLQAERQREGNTLLREIRDALKRNSGLTSPEENLVFN